MGLFSEDSFLMRFLNLAANLVALHFIWLLYSLPIFTIGASTTALYYSCMKLINTDRGYVFSNFHKSFKENFRQSTCMWLGILAVGLILFADIRYCLYLDNSIGRVMLVGCSILLIPFLLTVLYIFPVQATFENRIVDNLKNAFLLSFSHFPFSLLLIVILGTVVFLGLFFRPFMGLMIIVGAGLTGYLTSNIFVVVFRRYLPEDVTTNQF